LQVKLQLEPLPFWDEVELLVGTRQSPPLPVDANSLPSLRAPVSQMAFETVASPALLGPAPFFFGGEPPLFCPELTLAVAPVGRSVGWLHA